MNIRNAIKLSNALYAARVFDRDAAAGLPEAEGLLAAEIDKAVEFALRERAKEGVVTECTVCGKPAPRQASAWPFCSHDCGITDYYRRKDEEYAAERAAWEAKDPATRGRFESTVIFD